MLVRTAGKRGKRQQSTQDARHLDRSEADLWVVDFYRFRWFRWLGTGSHSDFKNSGHTQPEWLICSACCCGWQECVGAWIPPPMCEHGTRGISLTPSSENLNLTYCRCNQFPQGLCWIMLTSIYHNIMILLYMYTYIYIYSYTLDYFWYLWLVPVVSCLLLLLYARVISFGRMLPA